MNRTNVIIAGAKGDGENDDTIAIQKALDSDFNEIYIPIGEYKITKTLCIGSNKKIIADRDARIFCGDNTCTSPNSFLLSNKNTIEGNVNICIEGGIWDGNNLNNPRLGNLFDRTSNKGVLFNLINIKKLKLSDMKLKDAESYYLRLGEVDDFIIEDITFQADTLRPNQDGVHLGGFCSNGIIRRIYAYDNGATNDDLIALNADDELNRITNIDLKCGYIRNINICNIHANNCHTLLRMLSLHSEISNIKITKVSGGCRYYAINMDAARYCATPLFNEEDYEKGVGNLINIRIEDISFWKTNNNDGALFLFESNIHGLNINNIKRLSDKEVLNNAPTIYVKNTGSLNIHIDGTLYCINNREEFISNAKEYDCICIEKGHNFAH